MQDAQGQKASWLTLLRNAGDGDLNRGMVRLATLAAAAHRMEAARAAALGRDAAGCNGLPPEAPEPPQGPDAFEAPVTLEAFEAALAGEPVEAGVGR